MLQRCPKCQRKTRVQEGRKTIGRKTYWIKFCINCKTPLDLEEVEAETRLEKEAKERKPHTRGWL
jgi:hypothetical protein